MIARYNNISLALGAPGLVLQFIGVLAVRMNSDPRHPSIFGGVTATLGLVMLMAGFAYYAKSKGHNPAWCLMAFLSLIGLIVLACLPDLAPDGEVKTRRRRRRREVDYDDYEDDRPRRRRRRYADDDDDDFDDDRTRRRREARTSRAQDDEELGARRGPPPMPAKTKKLDDEPILAEAVRPVILANKIVTCAQCQKSLTVPGALAGKKVKCPSCGAVFVA
jgi:hypothetical protein